MGTSTILVVDDEKDLVELVRHQLQKDGFNIVAASDGEEAMRLAGDRQVDLMVLDLMLPGIDGLEVCRRLRAEEDTRGIPIIMLTAKASEADRVVGLEMGADDYVIKPFSPRELAARIKAVLRRRTAEPTGENTLRRGDLVVDVARHEVRAGGRVVDLTATEFRILQLLLSRSGRLSRQQIIESAIGDESVVTDRTIDVHITALRRKLGRGARYIETVRGFGYKFADRIE